MSFITFFPTIPPGIHVDMPLGDGAAKLTTPGGWNPVARPRRTALSEWQGQDPVTMAVPIMLDGLATDRSVEPECSILFGWLRVVNGPAQPQVLRVDGHVPLTGQLWVVSGLEWGETLRSGSGYRIRQEVTVTLMEYVPSGVVVQAVSSPAAAAAQRVTAITSTATTSSSSTAAASTPAAGTYTVKKGDTIQTIAQKQLGNSSKWTQIADMNGIRDARSIKVGRVLKLPAASAPKPKTTPPSTKAPIVIDRIRPGGFH